MEEKIGRRNRVGLRFDPNAIDADNDGFVQEGTQFRRPARPNAPLKNPRMALERFDTNDDSFLDRINAEADKPKPTYDRWGSIVRETTPPNRTVISPAINSPLKEKPKTIVIPGLDKEKWNHMVEDLMWYFADEGQNLEVRRQRRNLHRLVAMVRAANVKETVDGLAVEAPPTSCEQISKILKKIQEQGNEIRHTDAIRNALKANRNKTAQFSVSEVKAIGRRRNTIGGGLVRRFSRSARFDPNAIDADGDGTVQEGTQFARPAKPDVGTPKMELRISRSITQGIKSVDGAKAQAIVDRYRDEVNKKFGKIENSTDGLAALRAVHPDFKNIPSFLKKKNVKLTDAQKGVLYGYIWIMDNNPKYKDFTVSFSELAPYEDKGGSTAIKAPFSKGRVFAKPIIIFEYTTQDSFSSAKQQNLIRQGATLMDGTVTQMALAVGFNNPTNKSDSERLSEMEFTSGLMTAIHEGMHGDDFIASYNEAFGGMTAAEVRDKVQELVKQEGTRLLNPYRTNWIAGLLQESTQDQVQIVRQFEGLAQALKQETDSLTRQEREAYYRAFLASPMARGFVGDKMKTRDDFLAFVEERKNLKKTIDIMRNDPKYAKLFSAVGRGKNPQKLMRDDYKFSLEFAEDAMNLMGKDFFDDFESNLTGNEDEIAFRLSYARYLADNLSPDERRDLVSFAKSVSKYGGKQKYSWYGNAYFAMPVEAVAEMRAGIELGQLPDKGTPEYRAVEKFWTWMYGKESWNNILERV